jgi:hypothetical protein
MKSNCPPKIVLEGFFYDGKFPEDAEDHIASCDACREKVRLWSEEKKVFLQKYPFQKLWDTFDKRKRSRSWGWIPFPPAVRTALAFAAIGGLAVFAVWQSRQPPEILSKGGAGLGFYVSHEGQVRRGENGMTLPAGDDLQFLYSTDEGRFLLLFGVEADGTLTVYHPHGGDLSAPVEPARKNRLPQAIRWRPQSPYERFFALFSDKPVSVEEVKTVLRSLSDKSVEEMSRLPLPYPQASVIVYRKNGK